MEVVGLFFKISSFSSDELLILMAYSGSKYWLQKTSWVMPDTNYKHILTLSLNFDFHLTNLKSNSAFDLDVT